MEFSVGSVGQCSVSGFCYMGARLFVSSSDWGDEQLGYAHTLGFDTLTE